MAETKINLFCRNNKTRSYALKPLYFIKMLFVLTELWIFFYFVRCFFFLLKQSSWAIAAVNELVYLDKAKLKRPLTLGMKWT